MQCIYCGSDTSVVNSRHQKRLNQVWRRRKCEACSAIFSTNEKPDLGLALSVRRTIQLEPFTREKLLISVYDSLKHRPDSAQDAVALTDTIISKLQPLFTDGVIDRDNIVIIAHEVLARFDHAAATFYQAYHPLRT